jgi:CheY-like chemotaxis protein
MPAIAVVDDRPANRESLAANVENSLENEEGWEVLDAEPLPRLTDYGPWLAEHDVAVLIVDERLSEQRLSDGTFAPYGGHDVVKFVRSTRPSFPIFVVTAHQG